MNLICLSFIVFPNGFSANCRICLRQLRRTKKMQAKFFRQEKKWGHWQEKRKDWGAGILFPGKARSTGHDPLRWPGVDDRDFPGSGVMVCGGHRETGGTIHVAGGTPLPPHSRDGWVTKCVQACCRARDLRDPTSKKALPTREAPFCCLRQSIKEAAEPVSGSTRPGNPTIQTDRHLPDQSEKLSVPA